MKNAFFNLIVSALARVYQHCIPVCFFLLIKRDIYNFYTLFHKNIVLKSNIRRSMEAIFSVHMIFSLYNTMLYAPTESNIYQERNVFLKNVRSDQVCLMNHFYKLFNTFKREVERFNYFKGTNRRVLKNKARPESKMKKSTLL